MSFIGYDMHALNAKDTIHCLQNLQTDILGIQNLQTDILGPDENMYNFSYLFFVYFPRRILLMYMCMLFFHFIVVVGSTSTSYLFISFLLAFLSNTSTKDTFLLFLQGFFSEMYTMAIFTIINL